MKTDRSQLPIIVLAFSNDYRGRDRHLQALVNESNDLMDILGPSASNNNPKGGEHVLYELFHFGDVTISKIYKLFSDPQIGPRICIFHYGGHADGYQLLLQGRDGENQTAHGEGLVSALSKLPSLKLVFLNGCSTQKMAQDLVERGVPAVIGTSDSIRDKVALDLSLSFYRGLAKGLTLSSAWQWAKDEVSTVVDAGKSHRGMYRPDADNVPNRFPWDIEFRDEATREVFEEWNLPKEARQPLFGLPPLKKQRHLPESPFLFLQPYGPEHAELFFGRGRYIRDLYLRISAPASPPIILLYGESGSGKSSLLHAGLVPRLEAARDLDTQKEQYKVVYRRREQDLMLVGTLIAMLSALQEELSEGPAEKTGEGVREADPDREKIEQLEAMARELDDEARAYFLASIERFRATREFESRREYRQNRYLLEGVEGKTGEDLREMWCDIERQTGCRLILLLDQVEEIYTRPHDQDQDQDKNELEDLLLVLRDIFAPQGNDRDEVQGKIILGYREEFNAKIEARFKDFALSRSIIFLEQLNREDILEVFQSLENCAPNKERYNITIEDRLPVVITDDLLKGKDMVAPGAPPIAPVLQLILKKLWDKASNSQESAHNPQFTVDLYDDIQSPGGKQMEEFFNEGMEKVEQVFPELVESGLALDILEFHVSDLGTSGRRKIDDIVDRYGHRPANIVRLLVEELKKVFLLTDNGRDFTSLPHDTLAPIVMREYNRSDKLGQRSARILDTKRPDFIKALQKKETQKVRLDDNDLDVVKGGIPGMRALLDEENDLLRLSLEEREKRLRLRRTFIQVGTVLSLFILILTVAAASLSISVSRQLRNNVVTQAHDLSVAELDKKRPDWGEAAKLASFAFMESGVIRTDIALNTYNLYQVMSDAGDPDALPPAIHPLLPFKSRISSVNYHPAQGLLIALDSQIIFKPHHDTVQKLDRGTKWGARVDFSADGKNIQLLSQSEPQPYYLLEGEQLVKAPQLTIYADPGKLREYYGKEEAYAYDEYFDVEEYYGYDEYFDEYDSTYYGEEDMAYPADEAPPEFEDLTSEEIGPGEEPASQYTACKGCRPLISYDFFTGKFVDASGLNWTREELLDDLREYFGHEPEQFYFNIGEAFRLPYDDPYSSMFAIIALDSLTSKKLYSELANVFRLDLYNNILASGRKSGDWNPGEEWRAVLENYKPVRDIMAKPSTEGKKSLSLRKTSLTSAPESYLEIWDLNFGEAPKNFGIDEPIRYIRTLDAGSVFTVSESGRGTIHYADGREYTLPLPEGSSFIRDVAVSPDSKHLLTISGDSVRLWDMNGVPVYAYAHSGVSQYLFSPEGSRLLTMNPRTVKVLQLGTPPRVAAYEPKDSDLEDWRIASTRFHPDGQHLVIGLNAPPEAEPEGLFGKIAASVKGWFGRKKAQVVFWNLGTRSADRIFRTAATPLVDAAVSPDDNFAVAITPLQAVVIAGRNRKSSSRVHESISLDTTENRQPDRIALSPNGTYIVRQRFADQRQVDLFDLTGKPFRSYALQDRFTQGFNGQLFTPDDHYLIFSRKNEILLLNPQDQEIRNWADDYELSPVEKDSLHLDTYDDALPGARKSKGWGLAVMLLSLIFVLLYFSGFIVRFVQQRDFLSLGVYLGGFLLLALTLHSLWAFFGAKKLLLYALSWITLAAVAASLRFYLGQKKYSYAPLLIGFGLAVLGGTWYFYNLEKAVYEKKESAYKIDVAKFQETNRVEYESDTAYYNDYYYDYIDSTQGPGTLNDEQLGILMEAYWGDVRPEFTLRKERTYLLSGLLVPAGLMLLVGLPLFYFLFYFRRREPRLAYRYLLVPATYAGIGFWVGLHSFFRERYGEATLGFLWYVSALVLLAIIVVQGRAYYRTGRFRALATYGIATLITAFSGFLLTAAFSYLKSRQSRREGNFRNAFLFNSLIAFLLTGGILGFHYENFGYFDEEALVDTAGILAIPALFVLIFLGLRRALHNLAARKEDGRSPWPARLAVPGLWTAAFLVSVPGLFYGSYYVGEYMIPAEDYDYEDEELFYDDYYYPEGDSLGGTENMAGDSAWIEEAALTEDDTFPADDHAAGLQEEETIEEMAPETPEEVPALPAGRPDRQFDGDPALLQLTVNLFAPEAEVRDEARIELTSYWKNDPALVPALLQMNFDNPDMNEGIWNTLYILEQLSDEQLRSHSDILLPYLEWTAGKDYGPSTMDRIEGLKRRAGG